MWDTGDDLIYGRLVKTNRIRLQWIYLLDTIFLRESHFYTLPTWGPEKGLYGTEGPTQFLTFMAPVSNFFLLP